MSQQILQKRLSVDRRIVGLLSRRTYEDFPRAIRELVANAYDADATRVEIDLDLDRDRIVVTDNGNGMTADQFYFFRRIAGQQRGKESSPVFERSRIGQFGIGFLAIFPFGKQIQIESTARLSETRFEATVPAEEFLRETGRIVDVEEIPVPGIEVSDPDLTDEHWTKISVLGLTEMTHRYLPREMLGLARSRRTIGSWPPLERLPWGVRGELPPAAPADPPVGGPFSLLA